MLNNTNCIGAIVTLQKTHCMPNNTPLKVIDYTKGDCGTKYRKMVHVIDEVSGKNNWVLLRNVKTVLSYGDAIDNVNSSLILKQINMLTA